MAGPRADSPKGDRNGGGQVFQPKNWGLLGKEHSDSSPSRGPVAISLADTGVGSVVCTEAPRTQVKTLQLTPGGLESCLPVGPAPASGFAVRMGLADKCENRRLKEGTGQSW